MEAVIILLGTLMIFTGVLCALIWHEHTLASECIGQGMQWIGSNCVLGEVSQ